MIEAPANHFGGASGFKIIIEQFSNNQIY